MNDSSSQSGKVSQSLLPQEELVKRLEELSRQRERLIAAIGSSTDRKSEEINSELEMLHEENRLLEERLRSAEEKVSLQESELRKLRLTRSDHNSNSAEIQKRDIEIERLRHQIGELERKHGDENALKEEVKQLKVDLADALLEQKHLNSAAQDLKKQIVELKEEIYRYQVQIRDLNTRLDISKRNETALSEQEKKLAAELEFLRAEKEKAIKSQTELEERLVKLSSEREYLSSALKTSEASISELSASREKMQAELEAVQTRCAAAERREADLASAIESLREEKRALKDKIDRLLVGVKDYVTYHPRGDASSQDGVLAPRELQPYLPFCFPDRLPNQLKPTWMRTKKLPVQPIVQNSANAIAGFDTAFNSKRQAIHRQYHIAAVSLPTTIANRIQLFKPARARNEIRIDCANKYGARENVGNRILKPTFPNVAIDIFIPILNPAPQLRIMSMPPTKRMGISGRSFSFFLDYLASTIYGRLFSGWSDSDFRCNISSTKPHETVASKKTDIVSKHIAFHTRSNLQFNKLDRSRVELQPDFPQGRLKFLLQTFENSLNSMMARLEKGSAEQLKS